MPFKPGQSGNPNGRPKLPWSIREPIKEYLRKHPDKKRAFVEKLMAMSLGGDINAMKLVMNYMDGMPNQQIEMSGAIDNPSISVLADSVKAIALGGKDVANVRNG
jgi:hypothetical protein